MLPRRVPARQRMPNGNLDHDRQPGVLGQRGCERDGVGDVEEHVVAHDHIGDRGRLGNIGPPPVHGLGGDARRRGRPSTYAVSIVSLWSTPISASAGGTSTADDRPPPQPTSSTTPPCNGRTSRATCADMPVAVERVIDRERGHVVRPRRDGRLGEDLVRDAPPGELRRPALSGSHQRSRVALPRVTGCGAGGADLGSAIPRRSRRSPRTPWRRRARSSRSPGHRTQLPRVLGVDSTTNGRRNVW